MDSHFHFPENTIGPFRHGIPPFGCRTGELLKPIGVDRCRRTKMHLDCISGFGEFCSNREDILHTQMIEGESNRLRSLQKFPDASFKGVLQSPFFVPCPPGLPENMDPIPFGQTFPSNGQIRVAPDLHRAQAGTTFPAL